MKKLDIRTFGTSTELTSDRQKTEDWAVELRKHIEDINALPYSEGRSQIAQHVIDLTTSYPDLLQLLDLLFLIHAANGKENVLEVLRQSAINVPQIATCWRHMNDYERAYAEALIAIRSVDNVPSFIDKAISAPFWKRKAAIQAAMITVSMFQNSDMFSNADDDRWEACNCAVDRLHGVNKRYISPVSRQCIEQFASQLEAIGQ